LGRGVEEMPSGWLKMSRVLVLMSRALADLGLHAIRG
jgi:hypothetical protein